jgi:hypothetical protein
VDFKYDNKRVSRARAKMKNYENVMVIDNRFSDEALSDYFEMSLRDYAETMAHEEGGEWKEFLECVNAGEVTWMDSDFDYSFYLQGTTDIDVVLGIHNSSYGGSIVLRDGEWPEDSQEKMVLDAAWKIYNNPERSGIIEKTMRYMQKKLPDSIFGRIAFDSLRAYVDGLSSFDEKQLRLWMKLA